MPTCLATWPHPRSPDAKPRQPTLCAEGPRQSCLHGWQAPIHAQHNPPSPLPMHGAGALCQLLTQKNPPRFSFPKPTLGSKTYLVRARCSLLFHTGELTPYVSVCPRSRPITASRRGRRQEGLSMLSAHALILEDRGLRHRQPLPEG